jgi:glycosyltransferase involved in cell wall biosynthesis
VKISILHPSRNRPYQALQTMVHWLGLHSRTTLWDYILSVDSDDPKLTEYDAFEMKSGGQNMRMIVNDNKNLVEAANQAAKHIYGDIVILISDDFKCFKDWDLVIINALKEKSGVLKTFDGVQRYIVTLPIMTRDYYDEQGYIYYPGYQHMFCDTDQTHKADLQKKLIIRNDIVFKHDHYSKGGQKKDAVNMKADKTWGQGERVYLNRCRNKFGLNVRSVYDLSPQAKISGHVNWMKKKGIR